MTVSAPSCKPRRIFLNANLLRPLLLVLLINVNVWHLLPVLVSPCTLPLPSYQLGLLSGLTQDAVLLATLAGSQPQETRDSSRGKTPKRLLTHYCRYTTRQSVSQELGGLAGRKEQEHLSIASVQKTLRCRIAFCMLR